MALRWIVAAALVCAACGGKNGTAAHDAGVADPYRAALAPLAKLEGEALDAVSGHMGDKYTSDDDLVAALKTVAVPKYGEFVAGLEKLTPPPARAALHQKLLELARAELKALQALEDGVARGDGNAVLEVNREQHRLAEEIDALLAEWSGAPPPAKPPAPPDATPAPPRDGGP